MCEICSKVTIETPERRRPVTCTVNFEEISSISIIDFKQVNTAWVGLTCFNKIYSTAVSVIFSANIYLFKANNRNTRKRYEICSKLTIKTPERRY